MQLSEIEREQLYAIVEKYDHHPDVQRMREYIQHGSVTTYQHCKNVALVSFWLNRRLHLHADETSLAVGACCMIFICTTGTPPVPFTACAACLRCTASPIRLCLRQCKAGVQHYHKGTEHHCKPHVAADLPSCAHLPRSVIVCLADKYCAVVESMFQRSRAGAVVDGSVDIDGEEW